MKRAMPTLGALLALASLSAAAELGNKPVTFTKDVAPILQAKCQECHRAGSMAPMSLVTYEEARPWAKSIKQRVITRQMPPWHIDQTVGVQQFKNDMSLSSEQIDTLVRWVDAGAPMGDLKDMPAPKQWPAENEWKAAKELGQPDLIIKSEPYTMAAHHQDVWWRPTSNIPLTEPRWVKAVEMRPGTAAGRKITHHAVAYLVQDDAESVAGGSFDANLNARAMLLEWAVGKGYDLYRPNTGKTAAAGIADFLGRPYSRGGRGDSRQRRIGRVALSQRRGAQVSDLLDGLSGVEGVSNLEWVADARGQEHRYSS